MLAAALCRPGDALHGLLRRYKDGPVAEARRHHAEVLGGFFDSLLSPLMSESDRAEGSMGVAAVPSSTRRQVAGRLPCPVDNLIGASRMLAGLPRVRLERGPAPCRHLQPSVDAFSAPRWVAGHEVLVVDDTWVTGARARSAAAALAGAGAVVLAIAVIGRCVDPERSPALTAWWAAAGGQPLARPERVRE